MSQRISQDFVQELLARADIVEIIERRLRLKKMGSNYGACCPFHNEKTPSFTVSPQKQFYHCFGCGAHGNAIGFLMAYDRLEFVEAVEELAQHLGIPVPEQFTQTAPKPQQSLYALLEKIARYYQAQLKRSEKAQRYLQQRGVTEAVAQTFAIGYAPPGWDHVLKQFGVTLEAKNQLMQTGMLIKNDHGKVYDRFRDRLIIPIRDQRGRVIAFGGRTFGDDTPKYLNSPETPLFHKGSELFGLYEARQSKVALDECLIVEGYMDVIALHQFGLTQALATMGTATSAKHLQRLFRYTKNVVFCFDGDSAGQDAAWRALENSLPVLQDGVQIRFVFLPQNHDPDSLIREEGVATFQRRITEATPLSDFFFAKLSAKLNLNTPDGKATLVQLTKEPLNRIPEGVFRDLMVQQLALRVGMSPEMLAERLLAAGSSKPVEFSVSSGTALLAPVQLAIALVLQFPDLAQKIQVPEPLIQAKLPGVPTLLALLKRLQENPSLSTGALLEPWRDSKLAAQLAKLATWRLIIPPAGMEAELLGAIEKTLAQDREETIKALIARNNQQQLSEQDKNLLLRLLKERH